MKALINKYRKFFDLYWEMYADYMATREGIEQRSNTELCDIGFILRETTQLADDLRKEATRLREVIDNVLCAKWLAENLNDSANGDPVRGNYATGSPKVKDMWALPKKGTTAYKQLLLHMGIKPSAIEQGIARLHFPKLTEWLNTLEESGSTIPPELEDATRYPVYSVTYIRRLGITLMEDVPSTDEECIDESIN